MVDEETAVVMVGVTFGNFSGSSNGDRDMVVLKLDAASGTEIWRYQVRLGLDSEAYFFGVSCMMVMHLCS